MSRSGHRQFLEASYIGASKLCFVSYAAGTPRPSVTNSGPEGARAHRLFFPEHICGLGDTADMEVKAQLALEESVDISLEGCLDVELECINILYTIVRTLEESFLKIGNEGGVSIPN